jgi:nucleotide-binding universal stress UspA family protein
MNITDQQPFGVVVGVDGSEHGEAAARYGAVEADRLGTTLDLVHVLPASIPLAPETDPIVSEPILSEPILSEPIVSEASLQSYGTEILERAQKSALEVRPGVQVLTHLRSGNRAHELLGCAERAALLVLGNRSPKTFDRIWTGGTVTAVAAGAVCPVVVVPAEWQQDVVRGRVAVGVDTPGEAHDLLEMAFKTARDLHADLVVLHAWRLEGVYDDIIADRTSAERWQHHQTELIERDLAEFRERYPDVPIRIYVRHEDPAHALVRVTGGVDRLVLQRLATARPLHHLGRVGRAVLRDSRCPVVIQPSHQQPSHQQPSHQQPSHQQPSHQQPSHQQPSHQGAHVRAADTPAEALAR